MTETKERQQILAKKILTVCCDAKISKHISLMEYTLETIKYIKMNYDIEEKDLVIFKKLIEKSLSYGVEEKISMSNHYKKLYRLTKEVKYELKTIPVLTEKEPVADLNSWIKLLRIYKISDRYNDLEDEIYETSYELYQAMRKIILKKSSSKTKQNYVIMIVDKLEKESKKLPKNIKIHEYDYELSQLIKLVKNSEEYSRNGVSSHELQYSLERHSKIVDVKTLVKQ